jgi:hemolysin III
MPHGLRPDEDPCLLKAVPNSDYFRHLRADREYEMYEHGIVPLFGLREPVSCLSHLFGALVFAALTPELLRRGQQDRPTTASLAVMAFSSVQLLLLSSLYHMCALGPLCEVILRADVAAIFVLIAGSLTPVHVILFDGFLRWGPLLVAWTIAIVGGLWIASVQRVSGPECAAILLMFGWGGAVTAISL